VKTKYRIIQSKATPFGGLYVVDEFLEKLNFHHAFNLIFGRYRKVRKHKPVDNIRLMIASITAGGERLYDINYFEKDAVLPDLLGIDSIPKDTTLRDDFMHIGTMDHERQELLFQLNETHFKKRCIRSITIDIDGSALPVDGHQEGAEKGYCPEEMGSRCFQTLTAICDQTETTLAEQTYPGNTKWNTDEIITFCKPILNRFSQQLERIILRFDAGFYSDDFLDFLESYDNLIYFIDKPKHEWLQIKVTKLKYKQYYGSDREYASFSYGEGLKGQFRYYYVERTKKKPGTQTDLFESNDYIYRVIVSNQHRQPHVMFTIYNKRGRIEKHIEELKNQYALGKMLSRNFPVTKTLIWLSYLTFTIIGMLRQVAFRINMAKYRLRRLRYILFTSIAMFPKHARNRVLNISLPRVTPWKFKFIMERVWAY
jgi:hypothetical protein